MAKSFQITFTVGGTDEIKTMNLLDMADAHEAQDYCAMFFNANEILSTVEIEFDAATRTFNPNEANNENSTL